MPPSYRTGDFLLGLEGLAILRAWGIDPGGVRARADEVATVSGSLDQEPYNTATPVPSYEATEGYRIWAHTYDSMPNFLLPLEERAVHPFLDSRPVGHALDAACGTGRHTRYLAERGHTVVGIDATEEMLAVAREKVPSATFRVGRLEHLDLPDSSFELAICSLALTHLPRVESAVAELARVLIPGGHLVLSDVHPVCSALGFHAFFRAGVGERGCIQNRYHPLSSYLTAFKAAGLEIVQCVEAPFDQDAIAAMGVYSLIPEAAMMALLGLPLVLVWELETPSQG